MTKCMFSLSLGLESRLGSESRSGSGQQSVAHMGCEGRCAVAAIPCRVRKQVEGDRSAYQPARIAGAHGAYICMYVCTVKKN